MDRKRANYLLLAAAKCFDQGSAPFHSNWLAEHNVTLDECGDLAEMLSTIIKGFVHAHPDTQKEIVIVGAADGLISTEKVRAAIAASKTSKGDPKPGG